MLGMKSSESHFLDNSPRLLTQNISDNIPQGNLNMFYTIIFAYAFLFCDYSKTLKHPYSMPTTHFLN